VITSSSQASDEPCYRRLRAGFTWDVWATSQETKLSITNAQTPVEIAVLGAGRMGLPIARNLVRAGFGVTVWNRTPNRVRVLVDAGARAAGSPADAVRSADVVLTMLADGDAVAQVMSGPVGAGAALRRESVWIQMSTVGVDRTQRLAALAREYRIEFVDAPVSGSDGPARDAQLTVLASGPDAVRERVQPLFDAIGHHTVWLGAAGGGTALKVALNNWLVSITERWPKRSR
jgi:3-hydroxyisobutyrate dehydrogenase